MQRFAIRWELVSMRYLWIVSIAMIAVGIALTVGTIVGHLGSIALICGMLLLWSGIVKVIALRIWRSSLTPVDTIPAKTSPPSASTFFGQRG
jgi:hypothetical protein